MITGIAAIEVELPLLVDIGVIFMEGAPSNAEEKGILVLVMSVAMDVPRITKLVLTTALVCEEMSSSCSVVVLVALI